MQTDDKVTKGSNPMRLAAGATGILMLGLTAICTFVPWLVSPYGGHERHAGYSALWAPPSEFARVDFGILKLEVIAWLAFVVAALMTGSLIMWGDSFRRLRQKTIFGRKQALYAAAVVLFLACGLVGASKWRSVQDAKHANTSNTDTFTADDVEFAPSDTPPRTR